MNPHPASTRVPPASPFLLIVFLLLSLSLLPRLSATALADPASPDPVFKQKGYWTARYDWKVRGIHVALLRGTDSHSQILWWNRGPGPVMFNNHARLWKWDPGDTLSASIESANIIDVPTGTGEDIFCGGHSALPDGRLLVTGGTEIGSTGIDLVKIFDPLSPSPGWTPAELMVGVRYYPTNTALGDGRTLVTSGRLGLEMISFGGVADSIFVDAGELNVLELRGQPTDGSTVLGGTLPAEREGHASIFDATVQTQAQNGDINFKPDQRMLIFGGRRSDGVLTNDLWQLKRDELSTWTWSEVLPAGPPPARRDHSAVYDNAVLSQAGMIVFGGRDAAGSSLPDVWKLTLRTFGAGTDVWGPLFPGGPPAPARYGHSAVFYRTGRTMLVFGGLSDTSTFCAADVWQLSLAGSPAWSVLSTSGTPPSPREDHAAVFDPYQNRMLVFGGRTGTGPSNELYALTLSGGNWQWSDLGATVLPDDDDGFPPARFGHSMVYDLEWRRLIIFGGDTTFDASGGVLDDTWLLRLEPYPAGPLKWQRSVAGGNPAPRSGHAAVLDTRFINVTLPEVYDESQIPRWSQLPGAAKWQNLYPAMFLLPNGQVFYAAPSRRSSLLNLTTGFWETSPAWIGSSFPGGSAVMYLPGKIMKCGEVSEGPGNNKTARIDLTGPAPASWTDVTGPPTMLTRTKHNLTILPTGEVLVTGGMGYFHPDSVQTSAAVPQLWDPRPAAEGGERWKANVLAPNPALRDYHSTALLLPDGRVLTAGGEIQASGDGRTATIYYPPYLFNASGEYLGPGHPDRPEITSVDTLVTPGQALDVHTPDAAGIFKVCLLRPGAVTHQFDEEQRFVPLEFSNLGDRLRARIPASGDSVPPGNYMLFIVASDSLPSVASWVRVAGTGTASSSPPAGDRPGSLRAYPNPFGPGLTLEFNVPEGAAGPVKVEMFDLGGRLVRTLQTLTGPGNIRLAWDGRDNEGAAAAPGFYFARLSAGRDVVVRKVLKLPY